MGTIGSYTNILLGPVYTVLGVDTTYILTNMASIQLRTIDKTTGVEVAEGSLDTQTVRPACVVRMKDLMDAGYVPEDLMDAVLSLNGVSWEVKSYFARPTPNGEADGELYLLLQEAP